MDYIQRLPLIISLTMALLVIMIMSSRGGDAKSVYIYASIALIIFYTVGVFVKNTILKTIDEVETKKKNEEEEAKRLRQEEINNKKAEELRQRKESKDTDDDEEFTSLEDMVK